MDAVVEVGTAKVRTASSKAAVRGTHSFRIVKLAYSVSQVPTSTSVPSINGHSISAVAPDYDFEGGNLAWAA